MVEKQVFKHLRDSGFPGAAGNGPLYLQLADALRRLIANRKLLVGMALPSERELAENLKVSRITVRNAYRELTNTGELKVQRGSGTFVSSSRPHIEQSLWRLSSFSEDMRGRGMKAHSRTIKRIETPPSSDEVFMFGISPQEMLFRLDRLRIADRTPVAIERAVVPLLLIGNGLGENDSLYEALTRNGNKPVRATQRLTSAVFSKADAELLEVEPNAPCLFIERVSRAADGRVVEFTRSHYRGDTYDFVAELTIGN